MRPVLLAMNNPLSPDPRHALYPYPPGCTGYRILKLLQRRRPDVTRSQYLRAFERHNILSSRTWSRPAAREAAEKMRALLATCYQGRTVLVLGSEPRDLLGLPPLLVYPQEIGGITWRQLPHPSGRCRWYNDEMNAELAALLLEHLYEQGADEHGAVGADDTKGRTSRDGAAVQGALPRQAGKQRGTGTVRLRRDPGEGTHDQAG